MIGEDHLHIIEKRAVLERCGTPYFNVPASEKTLSRQTRNFLIQR